MSGSGFWFVLTVTTVVVPLVTAALFGFLPKKWKIEALNHYFTVARSSADHSESLTSGSPLSSKKAKWKKGKAALRQTETSGLTEEALEVPSLNQVEHLNVVTASVPQLNMRYSCC